MTRGPMILLGAIALATGAAFASEDPIAVRQLIMDGNGAAAAVAGGIMKDEIAYTPAIGKSVLSSLAVGAATFGDFFPEGSSDPARSSAAPKIWEDAAGFEAALAKFRGDTAAALAAGGKDGPADKAAFVAAVQPVLANCRSCHEAFRTRN
jgi:cytochrome c556